VAFPRSNQVIIINIGDHFSVSDVYSPAAAKAEVGHTVWINGKQGLPFLLTNKGETAMYAIGIKLGMLPFVVGLPAIETNDAALSAEHWSSGGICFLREQLLACVDVHMGFGLIEDYLRKLIGRKDLSAVNKIKWLSEAVPVRRVEARGPGALTAQQAVCVVCRSGGKHGRVGRRSSGGEGLSRWCSSFFRFVVP
jgi:hypothetical protein